MEFKRREENPFSAKLLIKISINDVLELSMQNDMRHNCFIHLSWDEARELKQFIERELFTRRLPL